MTRERSTGRQRQAGAARRPYPFIYSRDAWDARRYHPLGGAPSSGPLSR